MYSPIKFNGELIYLFKNALSHIDEFHIKGRKFCLYYMLYCGEISKKGRGQRDQAGHTKPDDTLFFSGNMKRLL
jgi:hypothetical protein